MTMAVSLQLKRDEKDYRATQRQMLRSAKNDFFWRSANVIVGVAAFAIALGLQKMATGLVGLTLSQAALMLLAFVGIWYLLAWIAAPYMRKPRPTVLRWFCEQTQFDLENDGIRINGTLASHFYSWPLINGINETGAHIFLSCDGAPLVTIPKRAFPSSDLATEFTSEATQLMNSRAAT